MELLIQILAGIIAVGSLIGFLMLSAKRNQEMNRSRWILKILQTGLLFGLSCAGIPMMAGTEYISISIIFGVVGFILGVESKFFRWVNYKLYQQQLLPIITKRLQDIVNYQVEEKKVRQVESAKLLGTIIGMIIVVISISICWAILGGIGGGSSGAFYGALFGGVAGIIVVIIGWLFGLYKPYPKE